MLLYTAALKPSTTIGTLSTTARVLEQRFGRALAPMLSGALRSHSQQGAPIAREEKPFPLLLFSPGLGSSPYEYSVQLEDLASHGYVVAALEHPKDTLAVVLPVGKVIAFDGEPWGRYRSPSGPEALRFYQARANVWAEDLKFVLEQLTTATDDASPLHAVIDLERVGAFGHSHGGRSAATACILDSRIRACLNEDGSLDDRKLKRPYWPLADRRMTGVFGMFDRFDPGFDEEDFAGMGTTLIDYAQSRLTADGAALDDYRSPTGGSYRFTLLSRGMRHTAFSDLPWLTTEFDVSRARYGQYLGTIRLTVRRFFDRALRGEEPRLEICGSLEDEVLVQCYHSAR